MFVAFMPYPTLVVAARLSDPAAGGTVLATVLYGANMTAIAVMFNVIWLYASGRDGQLLRPDIDEEIRRVGAARLPVRPAWLSDDRPHRAAEPAPQPRPVPGVCRLLDPAGERADQRNAAVDAAVMGR